jgi:hypothetical protein
VQRRGNIVDISQQTNEFTGGLHEGPLFPWLSPLLCREVFAWIMVTKRAAGRTCGGFSKATEAAGSGLL